MIAACVIDASVAIKWVITEEGTEAANHLRWSGTAFHAPDLIVPDQRDLDAERQRLCALIDRFCAAGHPGCTTNPHSFFGRMTPGEWAILMYKHLDHHLRQFGA